MNDIDSEVQLWSRDWRRLQLQKARKNGGVESGMFLDYLLYEGEHQSIQVQNTILTRAFRHEKDKNKLRLIINLARRAADRRIGRHWSIAHRYRATPNTRDPQAFDMADVISDSLIPALDYKLGQETIRWQIMSWLVKCGVCFEHVDWKEGVTRDVLPKFHDATGEILWQDTFTGGEIPESVLNQLLESGSVPAERFKVATEVQEAGDVGGDIYDPFRVFVDASVPIVKKLGPGQRIYLADIRNFEWIAETFGSGATRGLESSQDLSIIHTQMLDRGIPVSGVNINDLLPLIRSSKETDGPEQAIVLTMYEPPSEKFPEGRRCVFVPDQAPLDKSENPYPEIPIVDYHWSTPGASMWTTGFLRDLQAMSKFINKRYSQLGEAANAQIYELLLLGGDLKGKDIPTDFPGVVPGGLSDEGMPLVQPVSRSNLPSFFPDSIRLSMETLDALSSSDLMTQRKFPGQLRGPLAIPMLQELLDSEDGPRFSHLGEQFSLEKMMRVNRVRQFYPPIRTLTYTGEDQRNEVLEFHKDELLPAGVDFTVTVDPGTLIPELSAMREARVRERLQWAPGLYVNPRTGTTDWSKVGSDLKYNDRMREGIESQSRKLARQLIRLAKQGKLTTQEQPGQPGPDGMPTKPQVVLVDEQGQPFQVYPFWAHNAMMDEYEAEMSTTEFTFGASPAYKRVLFTLHDQHRRVLTQIDQARQQSVENRMVQGAMAQASQQAAAKAASVAAEAAVEQVMAQREEAGPGLEGLTAQVRELMGGAMGAGGRPEMTPRPPSGIPRRRLVTA